MYKNSHLVHVESLPEDSIRIERYNKNEFSNLYYSPSRTMLYQKYRKRIRAIDMSGNRAYARSDKGRTVYISKKKFERMLNSE